MKQRRADVSVFSISCFIFVTEMRCVYRELGI